MEPLLEQTIISPVVKFKEGHFHPKYSPPSDDDISIWNETIKYSTELENNDRCHIPHNPMCEGGTRKELLKTVGERCDTSSLKEDLPPLPSLPEEIRLTILKAAYPTPFIELSQNIRLVEGAYEDKETHVITRFYTAFKLRGYCKGDGSWFSWCAQELPLRADQLSKLRLPMRMALLDEYIERYLEVKKSRPGFDWPWEGVLGVTQSPAVNLFPAAEARQWNRSKDSPEYQWLQRNECLYQSSGHRALSTQKLVWARATRWAKSWDENSFVEAFRLAKSSPDKCELSPFEKDSEDSEEGMQELHKGDADWAASSSSMMDLDSD